MPCFAKLCCAAVRYAILSSMQHNALVHCSTFRHRTILHNRSVPSSATSVKSSQHGCRFALRAGTDAQIRRLVACTLTSTLREHLAAAQRFDTVVIVEASPQRRATRTDQEEMEPFEGPHQFGVEKLSGLEAGPQEVLNAPAGGAKGFSSAGSDLASPRPRRRWSARSGGRCCAALVARAARPWRPRGVRTRSMRARFKLACNFLRLFQNTAPSPRHFSNY